MQIAMQPFKCTQHVRSLFEQKPSGTRDVLSALAAFEILNGGTTTTTRDDGTKLKEYFSCSILRLIQNAFSPPPLEEIPMHGRLSSTLPFTSTAVYRDFAFVAAANEVKNKFVGGVSPSVFLDSLLPSCSSKMPMVKKASFRNVADKGKEVEMYGPLVRVRHSVMKKDTHGA